MPDLKLHLATCRPLPEPDPDEDLLLAALAAAGIEATMHDWRKADRRQDAAPTVVRSTWDYIHHLDAFRDWLRRTAAPLVMELELVVPSLFLLQSPPALERLVAGIRRRLTG